MLKWRKIVPNLELLIVSIGFDDRINEGEQVEFKATASDPGILDTLTYSWNFGDNVTTQTVVVTVDNVAPTVVSIAGADGKPFAKPTTIKEGESVTLMVI